MKFRVKLDTGESVVVDAIEHPATYPHGEMTFYPYECGNRLTFTTKSGNAVFPNRDRVLYYMPIEEG